MLPTKPKGLTVKELADDLYRIVDSLTKGIINVTGATKVLSADESGAIVTLNKADGIAITLPACQVGLKYTFVVQTAVSGGDVTITTSAATEFLVGSYIAALITAGTELFTFPGNGTTHTIYTMNGGTQGGSAGTTLTFECISPTVWLVEGTNICSDAQATSFS